MIFDRGVTGDLQIVRRKKTAPGQLHNPLIILIEFSFREQ
jgi:hypothetical protein